MGKFKLFKKKSSKKQTAEDPEAVVPTAPPAVEDKHDSEPEVESDEDSPTPESKPDTEEETTEEGKSWFSSITDCCA